MNYKPNKKSIELVDYLESNKNVEFKNCSKLEATRFLQKYNYINVITPFKYIFADSSSDSPIRNIQDVIRDADGNHLYSKKTDFSEFQNVFIYERIEYSQIYSGISHFELMFKNQVFYHFMKKYEIKNHGDAKNGFNLCISKVDNLNIESTAGEDSILKRKQLMKESLAKLRSKLEPRIRDDGSTIAATDIYLLFDRMYLNELLNIYLCLPAKQKNKIYEVMLQEKLSLNSTNHIDFPKKIFNLNPIRNCVMHFNSLEILLNYSDYNNKIIRNPSSRNSYKQIINSLIKIEEENSFHNY